MRLHAFVFAISLVTVPFAALAQTPTPPPPQPTPPPGWQPPDGADEPPAPGWHRPGEDAEGSVTAPDPDLRAVDVLPSEMRRQRRPSRLGEPGIAPTFALGVGARGVKNRPDLASASVDVWLGARFHPMVTSFAPFMAVGAEVNFRQMPQLDPAVAQEADGDGSYTEVVPEMRFGFAHLRRPHEKYFNTVFPNVELYGIAGWRIANRYNGNALRIGAGVSVPPLLIVLAEAPMPSMFEVTMDMDSAVSGRREFAFRFGWHF